MTSVLPALPPELRARVPAEVRGIRRDRVRLMVVDRAKRAVEHARFDQIERWLRPGDLLVVNTSRTLPAAVPAGRADGTFVQLRPCVRRPLGGGAEEWDALSVQTQPPHQNVALTAGERLALGGARARVLGRRDDIPYLWRLRVEADGVALLADLGEPIRYSYVPERVEADLYQTVYAARPGSAEPPSAGRPFTWELLQRLRAQGVGLAEVILHTGLSSFQDDGFDVEHRMFEEWYEVPDATVAAVRETRLARGGDPQGPRVLAVGTTVVRALETAAQTGELRAGRGWTDLVIRPGRRMRVTDALLTGFHEPQASHFDLLLAFVDEPLLARAYSEAVMQRYLWHEFGDATLIV
ncbi:MAG: S-adenosylmethionine:tRNA ribosyltransferase-isomerase [Candidatus Limnocylindria bacterium]